MPKPRDGESHDDYIPRCMGSAEADESRPDDKQRYAACQGMWDENHKQAGNMNKHEQLIAAVNGRKGAGLRFGQGFWTADKYVATLAQCIGPGLCQTRFGEACGKSFGTIVKEAAG